MDKLLISFCIPTRNFGQYIESTLSNILANNHDFFEVIVIDGGSTDNTKDIVGRFVASDNRVKYIYLDTPAGLDADLAQATRLARGKYLWLFSADDRLVECGFRKVSELLAVNCDAYLLNRIESHVKKNVVTSKTWLRADIKSTVFDFSNEESFVTYLDNSRSLGALFSFISSIIVITKTYNAIDVPPSLIGSNYAHTYRVLRMLKSSGKLYYLNEPIVLCTTGNDSFLENSDEGLKRRFKIDFDGFKNILTFLNLSSKEYAAFCSVMRREHGFKDLTRYALRIVDLREFDYLSSVMREYGYSWLYLFAVRAVYTVECHTKIFSFVRFFRKKYLK
ncbi:hypothetical protein SIID45300_02686 [Candidatus Magnetaquicoccaceae bacterium FCR-1]|uniref:Glycosyltransferase 2-like domain-containing protein n=1 Tax=Candidatus Magnetaquiglobus chichijimensis TaxID=3141448 RepID=A0ABQ0CBR2_9PROT